MPTLNWLTREQDLKAAANAEYSLLIEKEKYSYVDTDTGNIIVQGDNLEALKALFLIATIKKGGKTPERQIKERIEEHT
jgi:hypothetical protein